MAHPVDIYVGQRVRQRRSLLGMTTQQLADSVGITDQQIQNYETGADRISASRRPLRRKILSRERRLMAQPGPSHTRA